MNIKRILYLVLLILVFAAGTFVYFWNTSEKYPFVTQTILFCIDESEPSFYENQRDRAGNLKKNQGPGASAVDFLAAFYQEECIIIVSASVVSYVMRYIHEVSSNPFHMRPAPSLNPQNWIKKKISDYLYVLIPKKYPQTRINYSDIQTMRSQGNSSYTDEELAIGISYTSKEDISDEEFISPYYHKRNTDYPQEFKKDLVGEFSAQLPTLWISHHVVTLLDTILIPRSEYSYKQYVPKTALLLFGHGLKYTSLDERIASLHKIALDNPDAKKDVEQEIEMLEKLKKQGEQSYQSGPIAGFEGYDLKRLIEYTQNNARIQMLFIHSCFGSAINLEAALSNSIDEENRLKITHISFPIIVTVISSSEAIGGYLLITNKEGISDFSEISIPSYKNFFQALTTSNLPHNSDTFFFNAVQYIFLMYQKYKSYNNIPAIKYPGTRCPARPQCRGWCPRAWRAAIGRMAGGSAAGLLSQTRHSRAPHQRLD